MDMASDYESGDSGFESRRGSFACTTIVCSHAHSEKTDLYLKASVAQLVARKSHNLKVPGSIPGGGILISNTVRLITLFGFYYCDCIVMKPS